MAANPITKLTEEEYLAIERRAEFKSEFLDGRMLAMSGASLRHGAIQHNLAVELDRVLRGSGCLIIGSGLRVRVSERFFMYPDLLVVCAKPILADAHNDTLLNPDVVFEILSPSTEMYDRGIKFQRYRAIPSLQEYILVGQNQRRIEQFTRGANYTWTMRDYQGGDELMINALGVSIPLSQIYHQIEVDDDAQ